MEKFKQINIKNRSHYFCDDMINIKNFHSNLLTIDKKSHNDIQNIGYFMIKKFSDCENIHCVNPLYLTIHSTTGHFKEKMVKNCVPKFIQMNVSMSYKNVAIGQNRYFRRN